MDNISLSLSSCDYEIIKLAAFIANKSVEDFIINSAVERAKLTINLRKLADFTNLNKLFFFCDEIPQSLIDFTKEILEDLDFQPEIFPTACSTIQLEYEKKDGSYLEFELMPNQTIKYFQQDCNQKTIAENVIIDIEAMKEKILMFQ